LWGGAKNLCVFYDGIDFLTNKKSAGLFEAISQPPSRNKQLSALYHIKMLKESQTLSIEDIMVYILKANESFFDLPPIYRYPLAFGYTEAFQKAIRQARIKIKAVTKISLNQNAIKARADEIVKFEKKLKKVLSNPFFKVRLQALTNLVLAYDDFIKDIEAAASKNSQASKEEINAQISQSIAPLKKKAQSLALKTLEVSLEAPNEISSEIGSYLDASKIPLPINIEEEAWLKNLQFNVEIDSKLMALIKPPAEHSDAYSKMYKLLTEALIAKQFTQAIHLIDEMVLVTKISESQIAVLNAVVLQEIGLAAEAFSELRRVLSSVEPALKNPIIVILARHYASKGLKDKLEELKKELVYDAR
jgi:hypothetical protein